MDHSVLKKRLSTFKTERGILKNVSDELLIDILHSWEAWVGNSRDFYTSIGVSWKQMAKLMGKAKRLKREGAYPDSEFKEIKIEPDSGRIVETGPCSGVELVWNNGRVIRFSQVDLLLDFLKKAA